MVKRRKINLYLLAVVITAAGCSNPAGDDTQISDKTVSPGANKPTAGNVQASPTPDSINVSWQAAKDDNTTAEELEYRVIVKDNSGATVKQTDYEKGKTSQTIDGLQSTADYTVIVEVKDIDGEVAQYPSRSVTTTPSDYPNPGVGSPAVISGSDDYIEVNWPAATDTDDGTITYHFYYSDNAALDTVAEVEKNGKKLYEGENTGYSVDTNGWSVGVYYFNIIAAAGGGKTAYGKWTEVIGSYKVDYTAGSASGSPPAAETGRIATIVLAAPDNLIPPTGNTFAGWRDEGGGIHQPGETIELDQRGSSDFVKLTPVWQSVSPLSYSFASGAYTVTGWNGAAQSQLIVPSLYNDGTNGSYPVTTIKDSAFESDPILTSAILPHGILRIGEAAFKGSALRTIDLPNTLERIDHEAFAESKLTSIVIPDSVTHLAYTTLSGWGAFENCADLTSVAIGTAGDGQLSRLEELGSSFYACENLAAFTINEGTLATIKSGAFADLPALTEITLPGPVDTIEANAFANSGFVSITIPNTVTSFNTVGAFNGNDDLVSVRLPNTIETIGDSAFASLPRLTTITYSGSPSSGINIPQSVTSIGASAFKNSGIESIVIPNSVESIGNGAFMHSSSDTSALRSVTLPNNPGFTTLATETFRRCTALTSITIPSSVATVEQRVFQSSGLTAINIPATVTEIRDDAFKDCDNLLLVTMNSTVAPDTRDADGNTSPTAGIFADLPGNAVLSLPGGFETGSAWNQYGNITWAVTGSAGNYASTLFGGGIVER